MKFFRVNFFTALIILLTSGCLSSNSNNDNKSPDLIVYCENGMLNPVKEITTIFEKETGLSVEIQNDCARNLTSLIHYRQEADIFIPDSRHAIDNIIASNPEMVADSLFLGYQTLVFIVAKGNPLFFDGELTSLAEPAYGTILANPESSTLGLVTALLLKQHSLHDQVMNSLLSLTTDSRGLIRNISTNQASVAIGWKSDFYANNNNLKIDTIGIKSSSTRHPALAIILKQAPNKKNAAKYFHHLNSKKGKQIFNKYEIQNTNYVNK